MRIASRLRRLSQSASLLALGACASGGVGRIDPSLEMPRHSVLVKEERLEVRRYEPYVVAEVTTAGDYDKAVRDAFRVLAGYIFGGNQGERKVAMTAPVATTRADEREGTKIAMTAPVATERTEGRPPGDEAGLGEEARWTTSFMMPSRYTLETLPTPNDERVRFRERPDRCVGVVMFSGLVTEEEVAKQAVALRRWLTLQELDIKGDFALARYNDPFTLPWNRRNELHYELVRCPPAADDRGTEREETETPG